MGINMFNNYFKTAWRQLLKSKTNSIIKIGGLSISITFFLLVVLFIKNEFSFDSFHKDADRIYRVEADLNLELAKAKGEFIRLFSNDEEVSKSARLSPGIAPALKDAIPEITSFTRYKDDYTLIKSGDNTLQQRIHLADANFLEFFSFPFIQGNGHSALNDLNKCVITEELAQKVFGSDDVVGKSILIKLNNEFREFTVSALLKDIPVNSSIGFSLLIPIENYAGFAEESKNLASLSTSTFVKLDAGSDPGTVINKLELFTRRSMEGIFKNGTFEETADPKNRTVELELNNIQNIYLSPGIVSNEASANPANAYILGGIALLILIVACTNYISIALASSASRSLEVGVRKVIGAMKSSIAWQFLTEAIIISTISAIVGVLLAEALLPTFNSLTGSELASSMSTNLSTIVVAIIIGLSVGFIAGIYPAFIMSRHESILAISRYRSSKFKTRFTAVLVGFQFAVSSFLITGAVIMSQQMSMVNNYDLGYNPQDIIVIPLFGSELDGNTILSRLKNELAGIPEIKGIAGSSLSFGRGMSMTMLNVNDQQMWSYFFNVDYDFLSMLKIKLLDGRNFSKEFGSDNEYSIIINEALAKKAGIKEAGVEIPSQIDDVPAYKVVGITPDFNFQSLLQDVNPFFLSLGSENGNFNYALIKLSPDDQGNAINIIKEHWGSVVPDIPFSYNFMEETLENQYSRVTHWQNVVNASTVFAVFIAVLGLFGIAGLQAVNRTKEIGIRKVLGAGVKDVVYMINKNILITAISAFIISLPVSIYVLQNWLDRFAYRIDLSPGLFIIAALVSMLIAVATIAYHSVRAALTNPVDTIKVE